MATSENNLILYFYFSEKEKQFRLFSEGNESVAERKGPTSGPAIMADTGAAGEPIVDDGQRNKQRNPKFTDRTGPGGSCAACIHAVRDSRLSGSNKLVVIDRLKLI